MSDTQRERLDQARELMCAYLSRTGDIMSSKELEAKMRVGRNTAGRYKKMVLAEWLRKAA